MCSFYGCFPKEADDSWKIIPRLCYFYHWPPSAIDDMDDMEISNWYKEAENITKEQEQAAKAPKGKRR